jgi:hypothetical protein
MASEEKLTDAAASALQSEKVKAQAPEQSGKVEAQVESVIGEIINDHPHLRVVRESIRRDEEPADKFAREFLRVFRKRLQGCP